MEPMQIKDFINSIVLSTQSPSQKEKLLTIAGVDHLENVWSKIYAYFIDENNPHGLGKLFKRSLANVVYRKTGRSINISGLTHLK